MEELLTVYGDKLIAYVLALESATEIQHSDLGRAQAEAIELLNYFLSQTEGQHPSQRYIGVANALLIYIDDAGTTLANKLRCDCGGSLQEIPETDDDVCRQLLGIARDVYPAYLLPSPKGETFMGIDVASGGIFRHPEHQGFCRQVLKHAQLKYLYPTISPDFAEKATDTEILDTSSNIMFSYGVGGGIQVALLASVLLRNAVDRMHFDGLVGSQQFLNSVVKVFAEAGELAAGRRTPAPLLMSFANVGIPENISIEMPWGKLRRRQKSDDRFLRGAKEATLILEGRMPIQIVSKWQALVEDPDVVSARITTAYPKIEKWHGELNRVGYMVQYAMLLSSPSTPYIAATQVDHCVLNPLSFGHYSSVKTNDLLGFAPPTTLTIETTATVQKWGDQLKALPKSLELAMRRTISAATGRLDPIDGFVDAVIAWENMFSGSQETTFKVCGAIARLLEPASHQSRLNLFKQAQDLYRVRSKIVHGGPEEPGAVEAAGYRDAAVKIAVECMRRLYERMDLLSLDSSEQRTKHLLLGPAEAEPPGL